MKVRITLTKNEKKACEITRDSLKPFLANIGIRREDFNTIIEHLDDGGMNLFFSVRDGYVEKVIRAYGEFLPAITASAMAFLTGVKGLASRIVSIKEEEKR